MSATLIDSSVLLDLITPASSSAAWSKQQLEAADAHGGAIVNIVIWAEVAMAFRETGAMALLEDEAFLQRRAIPWDAAELAGHAHRQYRRRGGAREAILPDFLIAAHAAIEDLTLLTRDVRRIKAAFPGLRLITPESA